MLSSLDVSGLFSNTPTQEAAEEYMAILKSYAFTMSLVNQYHLEREVRPRRALWSDSRIYTPWQLYKLFSKRFDCEYDRLTGSLTLHFLAPDPGAAQRILGLYIDSLREKLRRHEIQSSAEAAASLEEEAQKTSDTLLQTHLYELTAQQLEREKLAQVQADFAFMVVEPPIVPDRPFRPRVLFDCIMSGMLALLLVSFGVIVRYSVSQSVARFELARKVPQIKSAVTNGESASLESRGR